MQTFHKAALSGRVGPKDALDVPQMPLCGHTLRHSRKLCIRRAEPNVKFRMTPVMG
jgi:hypothetical protein